MSATLHRVPMTRQQFLSWDETQERRWEYDGYGPVAMTGGTVAHDIIKGNIYAALWNALRGRPCRPYGSDLRVVTPRTIRYPDVLISCAQMQAGATQATDPVVVFEVLSPGTALTDLTVKSGEYRDTPTILRYVAIEQHRIAATVFASGPAGWAGVFLEGLGAALSLPEVGLSLGLADLYEGVVFGPPPVPMAE